MNGGIQRDDVRGWWVLATLAPFGLGAAPAFWYAGRRAGVPAWIGAGAAWFGLSLVGYVVALRTKDTGSPVHPIALAAMLAGWVGAFLHALAIRGRYVDRVHARFGLQDATTRQALADAEEARRIAREDPRLARELGIGRPDERGAYDAGLVDVNHATADGLARLPGVDRALARRIAEAREQAGGFASADDLGALLDLDPDTLERMRPQAVFLPR